MRAIAFVAWRELRRRWLGTVAAALLVGLVGALVLATVAGARRSDSALHRFNVYSRSADVELTLGRPSVAQLAAFARHPVSPRSRSSAPTRCNQRTARCRTSRSAPR